MKVGRVLKGIGLVFAGGGGKGAYEIGVWKYLHETGLDQYVRAVSGTSVGALNAALFVGSSYEVAENLWLNISQDKILSPKEISAEDIMKWLAVNGFAIAAPLTKVFGQVTSGILTGAEKIGKMMLASLKSDYMFSRSGIVEMISDGLNFNLLQTSEIPCYATCLRCPELEIERFKLNEYSDKDITSLLLASSAIPVIFPNEEFQGRKYCDGGIPVVGDNIPVKPVYDIGVENIMVVHLSQETVIDKEKFPDARIIEIVPREDLGNALKGTLDFSPEGVSYRLQLGYEDAKRVIQPMIDMIVMNAANQQMFRAAQEHNKRFEEKRQSLSERESEIKYEMEKDGFNNLFAELIKEK